MIDNPGGSTPDAPVPGSESVPAAVQVPPAGERGIVPVSPLRSGETKKYKGRFAAVYTVLAIVFAAAVIGFVVLVIRPAAVEGPGWSTWTPKSGSVTAMTREISDHIASQYRMTEDGGQLVAVLPSGPSVTSGTQKIPLTLIAVRKVPQSNAGVRLLETTNTRMFTLCGLGKNCSIDGGTPTATRGRLVRRQALETALYTFKFVPSIDSVVAFMPPAPGATTTSVILLEKSALKDQLKQPLNKTLPLARPPLPDAEDLAEKATIDKLTLKNTFSYELQSVQTGGAALVLDPAS